MSEPERVPVEDLVDLAALRQDGRGPSPAKLRAALPRGWVLEDDHLHARRDARMIFREGWILLVGLVVFGSAGIGLFYMTFPRGWTGIVRALILLAALLVIGGLVAPMITKALNRR